jgi:hypothetical protein
MGADAGRPNGGSAGRGVAGEEQGGAGVGGSDAGGSGGRPQGGASGGGQGGTCDEETRGDLIQRTLDEYCRGDHDCPRTLEAAHRSVSGCGEYEYSEEETGCGYTVVGFYSEELRRNRAFVFEGTELVGAYSYDDVDDPLCNTRGEVGGIYPPSCPGAERCRICDKEDGAGGAGPFCDFGGGGEGGLGGQGQSG